jgi:transcriptional regulator with GAF, ATPase, and Fis domain
MVKQMSDHRNVWLQSTNLHNGLSPETVLARLKKVKVNMSMLRSFEESSGAGIVLLGAVTGEVCDFIRETSRGGTERILALAEDEAALSDGGAWRLLQAGASDVLVWGELSNPEHIIAARLQRWGEVDALLESPIVRETLVGESSAWKTVLRQVVEAARFTDSPILLMGETGTGKELVARLIHSLDLQRSQHELVVVDCTTIIPELSGSELFGHEKGAFTGAIGPRDGAFTLADQGSLFLDEVGELPLGLQVQLLRILQERTYKRVGSNIWRNTNFRLICATNRDLLVEEKQGRFRRDLYYRIASWAFKLPSLRERGDDIIPLARYFMRIARPNEEPPEMDDRVRDYLVAREYPGNVRDLRNLVFRIMSRHVGPGPITSGDIPEDERPIAAQRTDWREMNFDQAVRQALTMGTGLRELTNAVKETAIRMAVNNENGNLQRAARRLGVTDRALQMWRAEQISKVDRFA